MAYDYIVVGTGVAGYPAAMRLADKGFRVAVVEKSFVGGECTNYGCVPSKALYRLAAAADTVRRLGGEISVPWKRVVEWVRRVVAETRRGIEELLEARGIDVYRGEASVSGNRVHVDKKVLAARRILVAPGTDPRALPGAPFDEKRVLSNRGFYRPLDEPPQRLLVVGAGVIGVEAAYTASVAVGAEVVVVEALPRIMPGFDIDVARGLERYLRREHGVVFYKKTMVEKLEKREDGVTALLSNGTRIEADAVLVAIGRRPRGRDTVIDPGASFTREGYVKHGRDMAATPSIYVAGDAAGPPLLAHKAIIEGLVAAENMAGGGMEAPDPHLIPSTVFTGLEAAAVGYTEEELRARGIEYAKYKLNISYLSAVRIKDGPYSFVKVLVDKRDPGKPYGIHILAPSASEVIAGYMPFLQAPMDPRRAAYTPYPHLTVAESIREVAEYMLGEPVHRIIRR